jgi:flavin reductase (DIM6/NTAB) family NADH-FMN oxidoreductase RutF
VTEHPDTNESFEALVSAIDYPMFVVTAAAPGERAGCLVGFVTQASIEPRRLIVMLSKANHTYRVARKGSALAVHFLRDRDRDLAAIFGEMTGDRHDKFALCKWAPGPHELPLLAHTAGWVVGSIVARLDSGDHVAHLIDVTVAAVNHVGPQLSFQAVGDLRPGHPA